MKKILIIGHAGYVGAVLTKYLKKNILFLELTQTGLEQMFYIKIQKKNFYLTSLYL
jgi:N-acetyl-gamma-glutamylphosphate reductase